MTSSQDKAYLKPKSNSFLDVRTDRTTRKDATRMLGITTTKQKPSAREKTNEIFK